VPPPPDSPGVLAAGTHNFISSSLKEGGESN
jgi:hypothetical protein